MKKILTTITAAAILATSFTGCLASREVVDVVKQKKQKKIIRCYNEQIGSEKLIDGVSYLVVDNKTIKDNLHRAETLCTSNVTDMDYLFKGNTTFNKDISNWDVFRVKWMREMFYDATSFNQDLGEWEVGKVETMEKMFSGATSFNQDLSKWTTYEIKDVLINGNPPFFVDKDSKMNKSFLSKSYLPNFKYWQNFKAMIAKDKRDNPDDYYWRQMEKAKTDTSNKLRRLQNEAAEKFNNR